MIIWTAWLSYRRDASENGLSVLLGDGANDNFWIDMTPSTVEDFNDAFMPGKTFSDYLTDVHITPIAKVALAHGIYGCGCKYRNHGRWKRTGYKSDCRNKQPISRTGEFVEMSVTPKMASFRLWLHMVLMKSIKPVNMLLIDPTFSVASMNPASMRYGWCF